MRTIVLLLALSILLLAADPIPSSETQIAPAKAYTTGSFYFTRDKLEQNQTMMAVIQPVMLLRISQIEYGAPFYLKLNESYKRKKALDNGTQEADFWLNATIKNCTSVDPIVSLRVDYLVMQKPLNFLVVVLVINKQHPKRDWTTKQTNDKGVEYTYFIKGFSNNLLTRTISFQPKTIDNPLRVYTNDVDKFDKVDWVEITVVATYFDKCKGVGTVFPTINISAQSDYTKVLDQIKPDQFSFVGLATVESQTGNFSYNSTTLTVHATTNTVVQYNAFQTILSCVKLEYEEARALGMKVSSQRIQAGDIKGATAAVLLGALGETVSDDDLTRRPAATNKTADTTLNTTNSSTTGNSSDTLNKTAANAKTNNNTTKKHTFSEEERKVLVNITRVKGNITDKSNGPIKFSPTPPPVLKKDEAINLSDDNDSTPSSKNVSFNTSVFKDGTKAEFNNAIPTSNPTSDSFANSDNIGFTNSEPVITPITISTILNSPPSAPQSSNRGTHRETDESSIVHTTRTDQSSPPPVFSRSPPSESVFQQQPINNQPIAERPRQHNPPTFNPPPPEQRPVVIYRKDAGSGWIFFTLLCILVIVVFAWLVYECVKQHRIKRAQQNRAANNNIIASEPVIIAHAQPRTVQLNEGGERNLSLSGDHKDNMEHDDLQTDERLKERMAKQASV